MNMRWDIIQLFFQHGSSISSTPCLSRDNSRNSTGGPGKAAATIQHSMLVQTSFDSTMGHLPHSSGSHPRKDSKILRPYFFVTYKIYFCINRNGVPHN